MERTLVEAMLQLLDDMGRDGTCVCTAAKAQARIAVEPFIEQGDEEGIMSLEEARKIIEALG